ncbi:MAG: hypothetical protein R8G01_13290 [Ilumatobacteraceae bacterium]|nr:hypothetical protein [Ilumatobacteraceae bacterium]
MPRQRQSPPFADRVDAGVPISAALVSAVSGEPIEFAERFVSTWFDAARAVTMAGDVLVFDDFVVGMPCALLLETAHRVRLMRCAESTGVFDEEEERWYDEHADDDDAVWEPPSIPDRVIAAMQHGPESGRVVLGSAVGRAVWCAFGRPRDQLIQVMRLGMTIERLVVELASAIRIGDAAVVDARLLGERFEGLRWGWAA